VSVHNGFIKSPEQVAPCPRHYAFTRYLRPAVQGGAEATGPTEYITGARAIRFHRKGEAHAFVANAFGPFRGRRHGIVGKSGEAPPMTDVHKLRLSTIASTPSY
jgi:hypothetical protein